MTKKIIIIILGIITLVGLILGAKNLAITAEPKIVKAKDNVLYTSQNTPFGAEFGKKDNPAQIVFKYQDTSLLFQLPTGEINWRTESGKLIAELKDKAFSYSLIKNKENKAIGVKEEIILKKPTDQNRFEFSLSLKGLSAKKENGLWHFFGSADSPQAGKKLFYIPKPFMEDANGEKSEDVRIDIKDNKLIITADKEWLLSTDRKYPITIDPSLQLTILTVHSHPQKGDDWVVSFETTGTADLTITPEDQATIDDDEFQGLYCGDKKITPQILNNDVIFVKNWQCGETAKVIHYTKKAGDHTLRFEFGGQTAYAYNSAASVTDTFTDETKIATSTNITVDTGAGQVKLSTTTATVTETLRPNATGDITQLGSYTNVDEEVSDDDATYVAEYSGSSNIDAYDLYNLPAHTSSGVINNLTIYIRCRRGYSDPTGTWASTKIKTGGTEYEGSQNTLGDAYVLYSKQYTTNPKTSVAWTWDDIDALQIGVRITGTIGYAQRVQGRCTQVYVGVNYTPPPTWKSDSDCKFGSCLEFNGTDDYVSVADSDDDWNFGTGNFTIETWVRFNNLPGAGTSAMFYLQQYVDWQNMAYFGLSATNGLNFGVYSGGIQTINIAQGGGTAGWSTNTWYHVAVVRNGNSWNVYRDGISVGSGSDSDPVPDFATDVIIGKYATDYLNGRLDEFRVIKGTALTQEQISADYAATKGFFDGGNTPVLDDITLNYVPNTAPTAPTSLLCEGQTNPSGIADTAPEFSAIYNDADAGDIADNYQIQVDDNSDFGSAIWDSTKTGMSNCTQGNRCSNISYVGSTLTRGTVYYWRIKFWDDDGVEGAWSTGTNTFSLNSAPTAPTSLEAEGQTNPTDITDWTPELTAIGNDPNANDTLTHYDIEVDDNSDFSSTLWHPGKTDIADFTEGNRCSEISYAGSSLSKNTKYYWRIKFWDDDVVEGAWSSGSDYFITADVTREGYCWLEEHRKDQQIIISWTDDNDNEDGYEIERSVNSAAFANLTTKAANTTSHTDTDISSDNTYQYRIRATIGTDYSEWCTTAKLNLGTGNFYFD